MKILHVVVETFHLGFRLGPVRCDRAHDYRGPRKQSESSPAAYEETQSKGY